MYRSVLAIANTEQTTCDELRIHLAGCLGDRAERLLRGNRPQDARVVPGLAYLARRLHLGEVHVVDHAVVFRADAGLAGKEVAELVALERLDHRIGVVAARAPHRLKVL